MTILAERSETCTAWPVPLRLRTDSSGHGVMILDEHRRFRDGSRAWTKIDPTPEALAWVMGGEAPEPEPAQPSPGPWELSSKGDDYISIEASNGTIIATVRLRPLPVGSGQANAHILGASLLLLDVARRYVIGRDVGDTPDGRLSLDDDAKAAIKMATGEEL